MKRTELINKEDAIKLVQKNHPESNIFEFSELLESMPYADAKELVYANDMIKLFGDAFEHFGISYEDINGRELARRMVLSSPTADPERIM